MHASGCWTGPTLHELGFSAIETLQGHLENADLTLFGHQPFDFSGANCSLRSSDVLLSSCNLERFVFSVVGKQR